MSGEELLTLRGHGRWVNRVGFSHDGKYLATTSDDGTAKVCDADDGRELLTLRPGMIVNGMAYSSDGKYLATAGLYAATIWNALTGRELLTVRGAADSGPFNAVAFSPDGTNLATTSGDGTARVWDANSGKEILTLRGHSGPVHGVAFSPDGKRLATAGEDTTVKMWDSVSGRQLLTLRGHADTVWRVAFSPDGKRFATASVDGTVQVYAVDPHELLGLGRIRVTRDFTPQECQRYFQSHTCPTLP